MAGFEHAILEGLEPVPLDHKSLVDSRRLSNYFVVAYIALTFVRLDPRDDLIKSDTDLK